MNRITLSLAALMALGTIAVSPVVAQVSAAPTLVNFQGRLATPSGNPVPDGTYSIRFSLWNAVSGGTEQWNQTIATVQVRNGTFAVLLNTNTANLFNSNLWLEIKVGADAALAPRQQIVSVPYALKANSVIDGSITSASIANGTITNNKFASGTFNTLAWLLGGNSATNPASQFIGTTDNQPLVFRTNNAERMRLSTTGFLGLGNPNSVTGADKFRIDGNTGSFVGMYITESSAGGGLPFYGYVTNGAFAYHYVDPSGTWTLYLNGDTPVRIQALTASYFSTNYFGNNIIHGSQFNNVDSNVTAGTIAGGGYSTTGVAEFNRVRSLGGTIGGGAGNIVGSTFGGIDGRFATVAGGNKNTAGDNFATVAGGLQNTAMILATVGGGSENNASGTYSTLGGGESSTASGTYSTIGGGRFNTVGGLSATVAGGESNTVNGWRSIVGGGWSNSANGEQATVGGGHANSASGTSSVVPGGFANTASASLSFAAGNRAKSNHTGTFVWADSTNVDFASGKANAFLIRASGGVGIGTSNPAYKLDVVGDINASGSVRSNGFTLSSDARFKTNVVTLNHALDALLNLRGVSYDWDRAKFPEKNFGEGKQVGFLAQEIEKIFPHLVMTAPDGYKAVNYVGVIPVLVEAVKTLKKENDIMKAKNAELEARLERIEAALKAQK